MNGTRFTAAALLVALSAGPTLASAQDRTQDRDRTRTPAPDQTPARDRDQMRDQDIYGSQLMNRQERNEFRTKMRAAKTQQEHESVRAEHHARMTERAKERGVTIPDTPPARGGGMGPGGGDMGPGRGR
jgi:Ni/Co efflux regulator RcnB